MRVTGIHNNIYLNTPLKAKKQKESASCSVNTYAENKNNCSALNSLPFLGNIIYFDNYTNGKTDKGMNQSCDAADFFSVQYFLNTNIDEDSPQAITSILNSACAIQNNAASVFDRFDDVYNDALAVIYDVYTNLHTKKLSWRFYKTDNELIEFDKNGNLLRETTFRDDFPEIIRDYKNNRVIFVESKKNSESIKDFTVCLKCKDIDDKDCIAAKESFTFKAGEPYRYCIAVKKDINSDRHVANKAYTYKDGILVGYDSHLTFVNGAEYSSKYYEFSPKLNQDYSPAFNDSSSLPSRFVTDKIVANGYLIHSSKEIPLLGYIKDYV